MSVVKLPIGGSVEIDVAKTLTSAAATPVMVDTDKSDAFQWRVKVGRPGGGAAGGLPAMRATFSFTPKGVPKNLTFGVKQVIFYSGVSAFFKGDSDVDGSIVEGSTSANFTMMIDAEGQASGLGFATPTLPFFSSQAIAVPNGGSGKIDVQDTPGGAARLVRINLVTAKRNFLRDWSSKSTFLTYGVAILPDNSHFALAGFSWSHSYTARALWGDKSKPTLSPSGDAFFLANLGREDMDTFARTNGNQSLDFLERNDFLPNDTVAFKINNSMTACTMLDAAAPLSSRSKDVDVVFSQANYNITHSQRQLF